MKIDKVIKYILRKNDLLSYITIYYSNCMCDVNSHRKALAVDLKKRLKIAFDEPYFSEQYTANICRFSTIKSFLCVV